jgi:hypothetical protein
MPIDVTADTIRIRREDPDDFIKGSFRTITLDKTKNIKAVIGKLKGETTTTIQTIIFPKDAFDTKSAQAWVEEHNLENYYIKQLLYKGTFPHPQRPDEKIKLDENELKNIATNTAKFLKQGGDIPFVSPPHPDSPVSKIEQTVGYLKDVVYHDGEIIGITELNPMASDWIKQDKVKTVSPGIVYDVITGHGKFDSLIDHVCITPNPHLTAQDEFRVLQGEKFSRAVLFFEGHSVSIDGLNKGGSMLEKLTELFESVTEKFDTLLGKVSDDTDPNADKNKGGNVGEIKTLQEKNTTLEKSLKEATDKLEAFAKKEVEVKLESFKAKIEQLIKDGKMLPKYRDNLIATFEAMQSKGVEEIKFSTENESIENVLLAPYEAKKKGDTTDVDLKGDINKIRIENKEFDMTTVEGKNDFSDYVQSVADGDSISYEDARKKVLGKLSRGG